MKILHVCAYAAPYEGNFIKSLHALENKLTVIGYETIYAFPESAANFDWCKKLDSTNKVYYLPLAKARFKIRTYTLLKRIFAENPEISIVHSHFELYDIPVSMTAPSRVKVLWHLHDAIENEKSKKERILYKLQYGFFSKRVTLLSVSSKHMEYAIRLGFKCENAFLVPNGIDTDRIKPVTTKRNECTYDFLIFGWDYLRKGIDLCIKAGLLISGELHIAIIGNKNTASLIQNEFGEVPGFVSILEPVSDIYSLYNNTKCFLHISRAEGLSYALLEAIYAGLPVICSDIDENRFASDFSTVTMVRNANVGDIQMAMRRIMTLSEEKAETLMTVRKKIENKYSIDCWIKAIIQYYEYKPSVCIFNGDMSRGGGTERISQLLANGLNKIGKYNVIVLNLSNQSGNSFFELDKGIVFLTLKKQGIIKKIMELNRLLGAVKFDVLINVDIMLFIYSFPALFFHPRTKLVSWEMFNIRNDIGSKNTAKIRKLCLSKSAYYVNLTKGDMDVFIKEFKVKCPITYIYNPCTTGKGYHEYDYTSKTIVTAGHFFYTKGYDLAIEVARLVFRSFPEWRWEFYGDGVKMDECRELVKKYDLVNNVFFCGRSNDLEDSYKKAAMYVMTSRTEGFGLVLTEAKSYNLPTLSFDIDFGPREIIENGISGYLVESFNIQAMADRICELIWDQDKRCVFSSHAKDNLVKFTEEKFISEWCRIIESVKR